MSSTFLLVYKTTKRRILESISLNNRLQHCCIAKQIRKTRTISSIFEFQSFLFTLFYYFNWIKFDHSMHISYHDDEKNREIFFWKFSKLTNSQNYHEWNRQIINVMRIANLYEFFDFQNFRTKFTKSNDEIWKKMLYVQQRNFDQNVLVWIRKNSTFVDRIVNMCDFNIQQLFDSVWIAKKTWKYLKKRYLSQNWFHKWFVFNRLKQIHYSNCKNVTECEVAYKNIFKEIIDLKITMKNAIMIKMFNNFDSIFETFLIVKNNETKKNDDFFNIDKFIIVVKQKKIE